MAQSLSRIFFVIVLVGAALFARADVPLCCTGDILLVEADGAFSRTNILVSFSEAISKTTATNVANYKITNTLGPQLTIESAVLTNGRKVMLTTSERTPLQNYILVVNGIQVAAGGNRMIPTNSSIPIVAEIVTLVGMNSGYRLYDPIPFFGDDPNLGTNWTLLNYNDATPKWGAVGVLYPSIFYFGPNDANAPGTVRSHLEQSDGWISYFRAKFNVNFSPGNAKVYLSHAIDDGAVFYLNANDILRVNVPDGPIPFRDPVSYNTPALTAVGTIIRSAPTLIPSALVVTGQNVLAVSLHQAISLDLEKCYGAQLEARVLSYPTGAVMITGGVEDRTVAENQPVTMEAVGSSYTIQQVPLTFNGAQFRVLVSNDTSFALSSNGTLRVIADTNPPMVLSAVLSMPTNTLQILYSEPVTGASATNLANYLVTNSLGVSQPITGATLKNGTNVILTMGALSGAGLRLVINGVHDIAAAANAVSNAVIHLGIIQLAVEKTSAWKYLLVTTNENVQTNYYRLAYNDTATGPHGAWSGPSLSVFYSVENGPFPLGWNPRTELPRLLTFPDPPTNSFPTYYQIPTYYFRKTISTPMFGGTVMLRGQVVYDDGVVIYLNGKELQRFNMPTGAITAGTTAVTGRESTDFVPTFDMVITNWVPGDNILAAEVHRYKITSSDMVFGLELVVASAHELFSPTNPPASMSLVSSPGRYAVEWFGGGWLESADSIVGPWNAVTLASPYFFAPTNRAAFYRVRRR